MLHPTWSLDQCQMAIKIGIDIDQNWSALISIGHWSRESWGCSNPPAPFLIELSCMTKHLTTAYWNMYTWLSCVYQFCVAILDNCQDNTMTEFKIKDLSALVRVWLPKTYTKKKWGTEVVPLAQWVTALVPRHFCIVLFVCKHLCRGLKYHLTFEVCSILLIYNGERYQPIASKFPHCKWVKSDKPQMWGDTLVPCNDIYKHRDQRLGTNAVTQCVKKKIRITKDTVEYCLFWCQQTRTLKAPNPSNPLSYRNISNIIKASAQ